MRKKTDFVPNYFNLRCWFEFQNFIQIFIDSFDLSDRQIEKTHSTLNPNGNYRFLKQFFKISEIL